MQATAERESARAQDEHPAISLDAALRWLTLTDQRVATELGRAMLEVRDERLYEREGHARWSIYLRAFVGRTLRWAQYEMRRERELQSYTALARAFRAGAVSSSQLRVVLGVVAPDTEQAWLDRCRFMSVRQLEAEAARARASVTGTEPDSDAASEDAKAERSIVHKFGAPPSVAALVGEAVELARRVAGYQVGMGEAISMMAAETLSGLAGPVAAESEATGSERQPAAVEPEREGSSSSVEAREGGRIGGGRNEDDWTEVHDVLRQMPGSGALLPRNLPCLLPRSIPPSDAPAHERVVFWAAAQRRLDAVRGRLLRVVRRAWIDMRLPLGAMDRYLDEALGLGPREAKELIRLDEALSRLPFAFQMYAAGRLSRSAAWLVAKTATSSLGDRAWTRWALTHSLRSLEAAVEAAAPGPHGPLPPAEVSFADLTRMCSPPVSRHQGDVVVRFALGEEQQVAFQAAVAALRGAYGESRPEWWCLAVMARHFIDVHADADDRVVRTQARRVIQRDNYTCSAPECLQRGGLEAHHIRYRSAGGLDSMDNLTSLCAAHHRHIQHLVGGMRLTGRAPGALTVRMGGRFYRGDRLVSTSYGRRSRDSMRSVSRIWAGVSALRTASMTPGAFTR